MTEFRFITNTLSSTTYDGPSGIRYVIFLNKPFTVNEIQDIEFFRKKNQFEEVGIIEKILPPPPEKSKEELFKEKLEKLKLNKKTKELILKSYLTERDFVEDLEEGYKLGPEVSKTDMNKIKFNFLQPKKIIKKKKR